MDGLIKNLVEPARSEEDLPVSAVTEVPLREIMPDLRTNLYPACRIEKQSIKTEVHAPGFYEFAAQILFYACCRTEAQQ